MTGNKPRAKDKGQKPLDALPPKANLRVNEVAAFLDCDLQYVYDAIADGTIPAIRLGRHYRIPRHKFIKALEKLELT